METRITINNVIKVTTAEIGLERENSEKFDNILATQDPTTGEIRVVLRNRETLVESDTWELADTDTLSINNKTGNVTTAESLWINWIKPGSVLAKGCCIPLHTVSWMKYEMNPVPTTAPSS